MVTPSLAKDSQLAPAGLNLTDAHFGFGLTVETRDFVHFGGTLITAASSLRSLTVGFRAASATEAATAIDRTATSVTVIHPRAPTSASLWSRTPWPRSRR